MKKSCEGIVIVIGIILVAYTVSDSAPKEKLIGDNSVGIAIEFQSQFGKEGDWSRDYVRACATRLVDFMDNPAVKPPSQIVVELQKNSELRGIMGWASTDKVSFKSDQWIRSPERLWIIAHELSNLFARHYAGTGGFPSDFWSNGRSPFPEYLSCLVMKEVGYPKEANQRKQVKKGKPDHDLFWKLDKKYGFELFARFFKLLRNDRIDLSAIGSPWPEPDKTRSLYTISYLSLAAEENLTMLFFEAGIGREPADWKIFHPEISFNEYLLKSDEVEAVLQAREMLFGEGGSDAGLESERQQFRRGQYAYKGKKKD